MSDEPDNDPSPEADDASEDAFDRPAPPSLFQKRVLWRAVTGASMAVIAVLAVGGIVVLGNVLGFLQPVLVPLAVAGILAYLLDPVVRWARNKKFFGRDLSRLQAMAVVFFIAISFIVLIGAGVAIQVSTDLARLFDNKAKILSQAEITFSSALERIENTIGFKREDEPAEGESEEPEADQPPADTAPQPESRGDTVANIFEEETSGTDPPVEGEPGAESEVAHAAEDEAMEGARTNSQLWREFIKWLQSPDTGKAALAFLGKAVNGVFGALGYIVGFFLVPIYLFFFLKDASSIRDQWADYVPLRQSALKDEIVEVLSEVNGYLIAYFRGQVLVSLIDGAITGFILLLMGLDYAIVLGIALAVLGIIPFVGFIVTAIPAVLIAAAQAQAADHTNPALYPLAVALVFIAVQQIDGIFIQPKIVGDSVGLHPLTVIFSVLFWSLLIGGVLGALLAVPLTAGVKVLFRRYIWEQKIRPNVLESPPPSGSAA